MKNKKKNMVPPAAWVGFALAAILLVFNGYTLAKYMVTNKEEQLYTAEAFYFTSDLLKPMEDGVYPRYELQEGVEEVTITLYNSDDALRSSTMDISYDLQVGSTEKTGTIPVEAAAPAKAGQATETLSLTIPDGESTETYLVTATATEPYTATIGAYFTVCRANNKIDCSVNAVNGQPTILMTVTTNDYTGKKVKLSWPSTRIYPDLTDPLFASATISANSCIVELDANSEYTFLFLTDDLSNAEDYKNDFDATES